MSSASAANAEIFAARLRSICHQRRINPASLMPAMLPQAKSVSSRCLYRSNIFAHVMSSVQSEVPSCVCGICNSTMKADSKTVRRHLLTDTHIQKVSAVLQVDPQIFLPASIACKHCGQGYVAILPILYHSESDNGFRFAGHRKDSLKRHEEGCRGNHPRSYTTNDLPDSVLRAVPVRRSASLPNPSTHSSSSYQLYDPVHMLDSMQAVFPEPLCASDLM